MEFVKSMHKAGSTGNGNEYGCAVGIVFSNEGRVTVGFADYSLNMKQGMGGSFGRLANSAITTEYSSLSMLRR